MAIEPVIDDITLEPQITVPDEDSLVPQLEEDPCDPDCCGCDQFAEPGGPIDICAACTPPEVPHFKYLHLALSGIDDEVWPAAGCQNPPTIDCEECRCLHSNMNGGYTLPWRCDLARFRLELGDVATDECGVLSAGILILETKRCAYVMDCAEGDPLNCPDICDCERIDPLQIRCWSTTRVYVYAIEALVGCTLVNGLWLMAINEIIFYVQQCFWDTFCIPCGGEEVPECDTPQPTDIWNVTCAIDNLVQGGVFDPVDCDVVGEMISQAPSYRCYTGTCFGDALIKGRVEGY